ncbi:MAG: hypothetical protein R6X25_07120 [Candidatus Krumholzibacteriia bacterium]
MRGNLLFAPIALTLACGASTVTAQSGVEQPPAWPHQRGFHEALLFVHPLVNYAVPPDRQVAWERERLAAGALLGGFGSVSTDDLMIDAHWALNPVLGRGLRLRNRIDWQQLRHLPRDRLDIELGFEATLWHGVGAVVTSSPAAAKEDLDLQVGGVWTSADRTRYVQVRYVAEDLVHDEKNDRGAQTRTSPRGVDWQLRLTRSAWTVASEGRWLCTFDRIYPDLHRSGGLARHRFADNELTVRVDRRLGEGGPAGGGLVQASFLLVEHREARAYRDVAFDHDVSGRFRSLSLRGLWPLDGRWRLRGELHRLDRRADGAGWRAFRYRRDETIPAVLVQRSFGMHHAEAGYVATFYRWREESANGSVRQDDGYADKVMASFVLALARGSELQFSVSHEVSDGDFGGGSIQVLAYF